ncbi:uncharacterized protein BXZ73DRAFT_3286, partial [Epithele typhae]|uniref:uncharacterized protein n=1 Tax=Epithele typhae TaxID=378194 RepID=UPI002007512B
MFTKTVALSAVLLAAATLQAEAHATIQPMLGLTRTPVRSDAIRPSDSTPCGNVNIAQTFDTSTTIAVKADRTFTATITNFNAGVDGSREIVKASFDPTGTGNAFQDLKIITNGQHAPTAATGSEQLLFQLRHGLDCKGGKNGKKCLVAFKTAGGFGNCVVVE